jgi:hypothetical protein
MCTYLLTESLRLWKRQASGTTALKSLAKQSLPTRGAPNVIMATLATGGLHGGGAREAHMHMQSIRHAHHRKSLVVCARLPHAPRLPALVAVELVPPEVVRRQGGQRAAQGVARQLHLPWRPARGALVQARHRVHHAHDRAPHAPVSPMEPAVHEDLRREARMFSGFRPLPWEWASLADR